MKATRSIVLATAVVLTGAVGWALRPRATLVETSRVTRGPLAATVTADGRSRVRDLYVVTAPVSGDLERVVVEAGDSVSPGEPVTALLPSARFGNLLFLLLTPAVRGRSRRLVHRETSVGWVMLHV